jgi:tetratricopeptide (TPR) repeat protein
MIELLLLAEGLLAQGEHDRAEHLFAQVAAADPRNAIAVVGLARVAQARGDVPAALEIARRALVIDPEDVAARRLVGELEVPAASSATGSMAEPRGREDTRRFPSRRSILDRLRALLGIGR